MARLETSQQLSCRDRRAPSGDFQRLLTYVKRNRKCQTRSEKMLWHALRRKRLGMRIRRQHLFGRYILDFYIPSLRINIEVDGASHRGRVAYDRLRDYTLRTCGVRVLRLSAELVVTDLAEALRLIAEEIASASSLPIGVAAQ